MLILKANAKEQYFEWGSLTWYVSGHLGSSKTMTFGRCVIKPGKENPRHLHPNCEEILHLISGAIVHTYGDERMPMRPGDTITIPAGVPHNACAKGDEQAVMIVAYSSADREYQLEPDLER
jgi:quercetin dioxygenase-like cupin family protein